MNVIINEYLIKNKFPTHMLGYTYLLKTVEIAAGDESKMFALTKELYPEVGRYFGVTADSVERAIRTLIKKTNFTQDVWECNFRNPTNKELISILVMKIKIGLHKKL